MKGGIYEFLLSHVTKIGVIGGGVFFASQIAVAIMRRSFVEAVSSFGYLFLMLIPAGAAWSAKKGISALVASEAEKRIQRGEPTSEVPAIQREMDRVTSPPDPKA